MKWIFAHITPGDAHAPQLHLTVLITQEVQAAYILQMIAPVLSGTASSFTLRPAAYDAYNAMIQRRLAGSVLTRCVMWYRLGGGTGKVAGVFPGPVTLFWWWMWKPVWGDYDVVGGERWRSERNWRGSGGWGERGLVVVGSRLSIKTTSVHYFARIRPAGMSSFHIL